VRRTFGSLFLVVGALLAVGGVLLAYGLTSEYGASPNGDASTDVRMWLTSVLPLLLLVGWLCWLGLLGVVPSRRPGRRGPLTGAVVLVTAVSCAAAIALGQRALEAH
jgi:membrane protease YdiL (CAAX protease family)